MIYFYESGAANLNEQETSEMRDKCAMAALPPLIQKADPDNILDTPEIIAEVAYAFADAMLKARAVKS